MNLFAFSTVQQFDAVKSISTKQQQGLDSGCAAAAKIGLKEGAGRVGPQSMQSLFLGANVFMNAFGGHTLSL